MAADASPSHRPGQGPRDRQHSRSAAMKQTTLSFHMGKLGLNRCDSAVQSPKPHRKPPSQSSSTDSGPRPPTTRSEALARIAAETRSVLPDVLRLAPWAPPDGYLYSRRNLPHLDPKFCPHFPPTKVRVVDQDTFDCAVSLQSFNDARPVCVLNMANAYTGGGGWLKGALAQEEALCYRSSLSFTLKRKFYPLPKVGGIYSPSVVLIRESIAKGHALLDLNRPLELPVLSVVSVAALNRPETTDESPPRFKRADDLEVTKENMRTTLRIAAVRGHRKIVLGALGCGAFQNPKEEVAQCWKEVIVEKEFRNGWWREIVFAVFDNGQGNNGIGNFGIFYRTLNGIVV